MDAQTCSEDKKLILPHRKLLFDGAFGTYYAQLFDTEELPERANLEYPERVRRIHEEYIEAGAEIIRTNTFASNTFSLNADMDIVRDNIRQGYRIAAEAWQNAAKKNRLGNSLSLIAADIGYIPCENQADRAGAAWEYTEICRTFLEEGAKLFVFETMADMAELDEALQLIGDKAFVIVQFSVNQFGYSRSGLSARNLIMQAERRAEIDGVGFNCGVGPGHMQQIMKAIPFIANKSVTALPNAGYPHIAQNRLVFDNQNKEYFAKKVCEIAAESADIVGGCCGTTPEYIQHISSLLKSVQTVKNEKVHLSDTVKKPHENTAFWAGKEGKKLIAVELAPPLGSDDEKLMDAAHLLLKSGVDVLTFPDSPSGRTRADSVLVAEKVARETGMCVMPHICCRDKNAIAIRSQLLGAYINHINNFLVVTGDPVPSLMRNSVKSVFQFDSVGLMRIMQDMNEEQFGSAPISYGGAINQGRRNLEVEIGRVKKKMDAGAGFFLTQPVSTIEGVKRLRQIKEETGARILCGIMPFVSLKNALFMKNEMTGIEVTEEVLCRYREDMTREQGEEAGIALAREMMELTEDFADGYYFSFPFNRVGMLEKILLK